MGGTTVTNVKQLRNCIVIPAMMSHADIHEGGEDSLARLTNLYDRLELT